METSELINSSSNLQKTNNNRFKFSKLKNKFTKILKKKSNEIINDKNNQKPINTLRNPGI